MTIISAGLFEALKKAGVPEQTAKEASSEVAEATKTVTALEHKVDRLETKMNILITLNVTVIGAFIATLMGVVFTIVIK